MQFHKLYNNYIGEIRFPSRIYFIVSHIVSFKSIIPNFIWEIGFMRLITVFFTFHVSEMETEYPMRLKISRLLWIMSCETIFLYCHVFTSMLLHVCSGNEISNQKPLFWCKMNIEGGKWCFDSIHIMSFNTHEVVLGIICYCLKLLLY